MGLSGCIRLREPVGSPETRVMLIAYAGFVHAMSEVERGISS
jgi:hypothetical protein